LAGRDDGDDEDEFDEFDKSDKSSIHASGHGESASKVEMETQFVGTVSWIFKDVILGGSCLRFIGTASAASLTDDACSNCKIAASDILTIFKDNVDLCGSGTTSSVTADLGIHGDGTGTRICGYLLMWERGQRSPWPDPTWSRKYNCRRAVSAAGETSGRIRAHI